MVMSRLHLPGVRTSPVDLYRGTSPVTYTASLDENLTMSHGRFSVPFVFRPWVGAEAVRDGADCTPWQNTQVLAAVAMRGYGLPRQIVVTSRERAVC